MLASSRICGTRPAVRDGDAPRAQVQAAFVVQDPDRLRDRARFASGSPMPMNTMLKRSSCQPRASPIATTCATISSALQVALQPHEAGGAEAAPERAAHLARDAQRQAPLGAHRDALDARAVAELEHELVRRAVARCSAPEVSGRARSHTAPSSLRSAAGRLVMRTGAALVLAVDPREDLVGAVAGHAQARQPFGEPVAAQAEETGDMHGLGGRWGVVHACSRRGGRQLGTLAISGS